jgi:hypothetical protein
MTIKFGRNGQAIGDYPEESVPDLLRTKVLLLTDLYWHEGMPEWKAVASRWSEPPPPADESAALKLKRFEGRPRVTGFILLGLGILLGWLCVWDPLNDAADHAQSVSISLKGILLVPLLLITGSLYAFAPAFAVKTLGTPQERKPAAWIVAIPLLLLGGLLYYLVKRKLEEYGYQF